MSATAKGRARAARYGTTVPDTLLLHSLAEFERLLHACFDITAARTFVEIGSELGGFTRELVDRASSLTTIDPEPAPAVVALARERGDVLRLLCDRSPGSLAEVGAADAWVIDGDHNYWTVRQEIEEALTKGERAGSTPLILVHDVGWPCARRDFYYAPELLPPEAVHPHTFTQGVVPQSQGVVDSGLRGEGHLAVALEEGGPRNGVLTAVEDVMAERPGLRLAIVPVIYGLGLLWPEDAPWGEALSTLLAPYDQLPLLERLERNRIDLYLRVLELQDRVRHVNATQARVLARDDQRLAELEAENAALRVRLARAGGPG